MFFFFVSCLALLKAILRDQFYHYSIVLFFFFMFIIIIVSLSDALNQTKYSVFKRSVLSQRIWSWQSEKVEIQVVGTAVIISNEQNNGSQAQERLKNPHKNDCPRALLHV